MLQLPLLLTLLPILFFTKCHTSLYNLHIKRKLYSGFVAFGYTVGCYAVVIGRSNTGNNKGFVDIHPATDGVNDFEHNTSPRNDN